MEKVSLPIKTKIAAWLILLFGISSIILFFAWLIIPKISKLLSSLYLVAEGGKGFVGLLILGPFLVWIARGLLDKKQWAWWWSVVFIGWSIALDLIWILTLLLLTKKEFVVHLALMIILFILGILLFFDRKNFWKIAT